MATHTLTMSLILSTYLLTLSIVNMLLLSVRLMKLPSFLWMIMFHHQWPLRTILSDEEKDILDNYWGTDLYEPYMARIIKKYQSVYDYLNTEEE